MYHIHLLRTCHSRVASVHTFLNLRPFITRTLSVPQVCVAHVPAPLPAPHGRLGRPRPAPLGGSGEWGEEVWRSQRQDLDLHRREEKVAPGFTAGGQEIIVDTKPKWPLLGPGNQASPGFGLTA